MLQNNHNWQVYCEEWYMVEREWLSIVIQYTAHRRLVHKCSQVYALLEYAFLPLGCYNTHHHLLRHYHMNAIIQHMWYIRNLSARVECSGLSGSHAICIMSSLHSKNHFNTGKFTAPRFNRVLKGLNCYTYICYCCYCCCCPAHILFRACAEVTV